MGVSQSKNAVDIVNESIVDVIISNVNNCSVQSTQQQNVDFGGFGLFSSVKQNLTISAQCLQNVKIDNDILTQMANKIQQAAESQSIALMPSYSGANNTNNLKNYLATKINTSTVQACAASAIQQQNVSISGVQIGARAEQTAEVFSKCLQTVLNNNSVAQGIVNDASQTAVAKNESPLAFLGNIFGIIIIVVVIIIIIILAFLFWPSGGGAAASVVSIEIAENKKEEESNSNPA